MHFDGISGRRGQGHEPKAWNSLWRGTAATAAVESWEVTRVELRPKLRPGCDLGCVHLEAGGSKCD